MTKSRLVVAENVAVVESEGVIYAAPLPDGPITVLADTAAEIWRCAVRGTRARLPDRVARRCNLPRATVVDDVETFVTVLIDAGLLRVGYDDAVT